MKKAKPYLKYRKPPWIRRYAAAESACPKCGAKPEEPCVRLNGKPRLSIHRERLLLAPTRKTG